MKRTAPLTLPSKPHLLLAATSLALAACSPASNDPGPGGVTVDEAKALDEAAEMIEMQRLPQEALPQGSQTNTQVELPPESPVNYPAEPGTGE